MRWLSNVSVVLDVPIELAAMQTTELNTGNHRVELIYPILERSWQWITEPPNTPDYMLYAGLYREGINSSSPLYQFLCLYKIIEGLVARRERLNTAIVARGETPRRNRERLPSKHAESAEFLAPLFRGLTWNESMTKSVFIPEVAGKRLSAVIKDPMRELRNRVAHAVIDSGEPTVDADTELHVRAVEHWLPITKVLARYLLQAEFPREFGSADQLCALELIPSADALPNDGVVESSTISHIQAKATIMRSPD
ncbi:MAG: hypothetical protein P4L40_24655 [Terracidiphilus sp.]|nr:hypothetical protein [Terracidiphilus sp.]